MEGSARKQWEGTQKYPKPSPGTRARAASLIREELAAKQKEDREKKKSEALQRRRFSTSSSPGAMSNSKGRRDSLRGAAPRSEAPSTGEKPPPCPAPDNDDIQMVEDDNDGMDPAHARFFRAMEKRLAESSSKTADNLTRLLQSNIERIDANAIAVRELRGLEATMEKKIQDKFDEGEARAVAREIDLEKRITLSFSRKLDETLASAVSTRPTAPNIATGAPVQAAGRVSASRKEEAFFRCRRSLKMWPVVGEDLVDAARSFMSVSLKLTTNVIESLGDLEVNKRPGRVAEEKKEVIVYFANSDDRDMVKAAGVNLAGTPTAGISIHVPGFLLDNLHLLNAVGYSIKNNFDGVRRSVKFDDLNLNIFMDIKIGSQWKRITPEEARRVSANLPQATRNNSREFSTEDLSALVQGSNVAGLTAVAIPDDE